MLLYCVGALRLKRSAIQQLSICWNDAFRRIFNYKRSESVKSLQVNFGTLDFKHLYDLHRWKFPRTVGSKSMYWANFVKITDLQYHVCIDLADAYFQDSRPMSFANAVYCHCRNLV